jgi:hypothetical protein
MVKNVMAITNWGFSAGFGRSFVTTQTRFFGAGAPQNFTPLENSPPPRKTPPQKNEDRR